MSATNSTAAALPTALALIGALALPDDDRTRVLAKEIVIPPTPVAVERFYAGEERISICSFNIQFLGNSRRRDCGALGAVLAGFDIVVVQELVSPPYEGKFSGGKKFTPDQEAAEFFDVMITLGFEYVLSNEDTGTGDTIHRNGSATEWWVAFYQPDRVQVAEDLPAGFLAADRSNHADYERVPFAFPFRTFDGGSDFVLISVHLQPGARTANAKRRRHELASIGKWVDQHDEVEKDFIIIGDMNIEDAEELAEATPEGFASLNDETVQTNTNVRSPKPYDHAMIHLDGSGEIDRSFDFKVVNIVEIMENLWKSTDPYPGNPYKHNPFRAFFSDHHPVVIHLTFQEEDDD